MKISLENVLWSSLFAVLFGAIIYIPYQHHASIWSQSAVVTDVGPVVHGDHWYDNSGCFISVKMDDGTEDQVFSLATRCVAVKPGSRMTVTNIGGQWGIREQ